jgi:succinate-semialdehyde dehydrogenase/glutarate-semialdehyde dehydrogenase
MDGQMYTDTLLHIDGHWRAGGSAHTQPVVNPATEAVIGTVAHADRSDLDEALAAAERGFRAWSQVSANERYKLLRTAADAVRRDYKEIGRLMTLEQGKTLPESQGEAYFAGDLIDWFAEEARRTYGREIPSRATGIRQITIKEPVGPVAAFTPWNFPLNQAVRKISGALAAGCSIILKGPEETPASCAALVKAFVDAGLPEGVLNLVYGVPAEISAYLIPHPVIKKVTFTGSTAVGKHLASLAGLHMKRATMELGGHAPVIVCDDADIENAVRVLADNKFRNAGQACISPTRFLVQSGVLEEFTRRFVETAEAMVVGDGLDEKTDMGPLANDRRLVAVQDFVADAVALGATVETGGERLGDTGYFYKPTVLTNVPLEAKLMNEEPFGPVAAIAPFETLDKAIAEANRLGYGLAAYAYTGSLRTAETLKARVETGMLAINHHGMALPEVPFGGIKDSGYGTEGGADAIEAYLNTKFVTQYQG